MMDDAHAPEIVSGQLKVIKTYLKTRYRLSYRLRPQQKDRTTSNLKRWIENGASDKGDMEGNNHKILKQFNIKRRERICYS